MASSSLSKRILFEPIRTIAFGAISAVYAAVGTATTNAARQIMVVNGTEGTMIFSTSSSLAAGEFVLLAGTSLILDITSNKTHVDGFYLSAGTQLYVKQATAPVSGSVYFTVMYGR